MSSTVSKRFVQLIAKTHVASNSNIRKRRDEASFTCAVEAVQTRKPESPADSNFQPPPSPPTLPSFDISFQRRYPSCCERVTWS